MFFLAIPKKRSVCLSACQLFGNCWEDADRICRSLDMSIPLIKTIQDVESIGKGYVSEKNECGFMTFLAMRRNHKVITVYLKK